MTYRQKDRQTDTEELRTEIQKQTNRGTETMNGDKIYYLDIITL